MSPPDQFSLSPDTGDGTTLKGLNHVHRMGVVEGLHHLDAKALVSGEEHGVVDAASG
ncbi:MAG: hypothetical protein ACK5GZ_05085 [Cyanobium sp.]